MSSDNQQKVTQEPAFTTKENAMSEQRIKILNWHHANRKNQSKTAKHLTQHPEVTEMLDLWVSKAMADGILLTGMVLRQQWKKFANLVGVPEDERLHLSEGWLTWYKTRTGLREMKHHGEAASAASETIHKE
ncbi:hypothetical protein BS17DRAFT_767408 [Gyrodon lividus]|nr:hypothetical protein BS17DRAFT_767408 [Gyrodon lividus]